MAESTPGKQTPQTSASSPDDKPATADPDQEPASAATDPVENVSPEEMARFITTIKNPAQQVGEHVVAALQHADTVAVLTTVVIGPAGDRHIISAALNPTQMALVNELLQQSAIEREEEEPCVGFHCLIKPKRSLPSAKQE